MRSQCKPEEILRRDGLLVRDDLLANTIFSDYARRARNSWQSQEGWMTRVKGPGVEQTFPLLPKEKVQEIGSFLDACSMSNPDEFCYLYHSLNKSNENKGLIEEITRDVIKAWQDCLSNLIAFPYKTNFSLTAYTPHCRLTSHTDYSSVGEPYRLTLLLYFGGEADGVEPLYFKFNEHQQRIMPRRNRSVLFVPTLETEHWIQPVPESPTQSVRLAFSGWLM